MTGEVSQTIQEKLDSLKDYLQFLSRHFEREAGADWESDVKEVLHYHSLVNSIEDYIDYLEDQLWQYSLEETI